MTWQSISEPEIWKEINAGYERMNLQQRQQWDAIKVAPVKWQLKPWGDQGDGFWVVAIIGQTVIWCNDIEDGFNRSNFTASGRIDDYYCNQDELEHCVQQIIDQKENGCDASTKLGPPESIT